VIFALTPTHFFGGTKWRRLLLFRFMLIDARALRVERKWFNLRSFSRTKKIVKKDETEKHQIFFVVREGFFPSKVD